MPSTVQRQCRSAKRLTVIYRQIQLVEEKANFAVAPIIGIAHSRARCSFDRRTGVSQHYLVETKLCYELRVTVLCCDQELYSCMSYSGEGVAAHSCLEVSNTLVELRLGKGSSQSACA